MARYRIDADVDFDFHNILPFDKKIDATVRYRVLNSKTNSLAFEKLVNSSYTAKYQGQTLPLAQGMFSSNDRWKEAYRQAVRENIRMFLSNLSNWQRTASMDSRAVRASI